MIAGRPLEHTPHSGEGLHKPQISHIKCKSHSLRTNHTLACVQTPKKTDSTSHRFLIFLNEIGRHSAPSPAQQFVSTPPAYCTTLLTYSFLRVN